MSLQKVAVGAEARLRALQGVVAFLLVNQAASKDQAEWLADQLAEILGMNADVDQRVQQSNKLTSEQKEAIRGQLMQVHAALEDIFDDAQLMLKQRKSGPVTETIR